MLPWIQDTSGPRLIDFCLSSEEASCGCLVFRTLLVLDCFVNRFVGTIVQSAMCIALVALPDRQRVASADQGILF